MTRSQKRTTVLTAVLLTLALCFSLTADYFRLASRVRESVLRLHVIANSDSGADQTVKLLVRDALLKKGADLFDGSVTAEDAEARILPQKRLLEEEANRVLRENGCGYNAEVTVTTEFFDTRAYDEFTLPAGTYRAVKVVLGKGQGQNWWCVMFPPLCLPAATKEEAAEAFAPQDYRVLQPKKGYAVRFKLVEIWETLWEKLKAHASSLTPH